MSAHETDKIYCQYLTGNVPVTAATKLQYEFTWYDGNCQDEATKEQIIKMTVNALQNGGPSILGLGFQAHIGLPLKADDFEVFCGPKVSQSTHLGFYSPRISLERCQCYRKTTVRIIMIAHVTVIVLTYCMSVL